MPIAGVTSNTVPSELLRAAGFFPLMLNPPRGPAAYADHFMEVGVFSARIRGIFHGITAGLWPFLKLVIIPRTSEQEHKLYLYLREIARQGLGKSVPEVYLYNLLHSRSAETEEYGFERTRDLKKHLEQLAGRSIEAADLARCVCESNQARVAIRSLLNLREGTEPRLRGTEALSLIGAAYFMDHAAYAQLAAEAGAEMEERPPARGARLLIKGTPLHHTGLHQAIESHGAVVVAEDDWWGSRCLGEPIAADADMVRSIFDAYYRGTSGPRAFPPEMADKWFFEAAAKADGVVFYLPPEDDVLGWDYPALRAALAQRGIPSLLVREDAAEGLSSECHQKIEEFVSKIPVRS